MTFNSPDDEALFAINVTDYASTPPKFQKKTALNTWADVANGAFIVPAVLVRLDVYLKIHATEGVFRLYVDGAICIDYTGDTTAYRTNFVNRIGFGSTSTTSNGGVHSAAIIADIDTRPLTFHQRLPTGNGAETDWTGDYTSVDETGLNDADFIKATALDDVETFTFPDLPVYAATQLLETLVISGRARNSGDIQEIKGIARVGSTNYEAPAVFDSSPTFLMQQWQLPLNPANGQPWTGADIDAAEFGVKAT